MDTQLTTNEVATRTGLSAPYLALLRARRVDRTRGARAAAGAAMQHRTWMDRVPIASARDPYADRADAGLRQASRQRERHGPGTSADAHAFGRRTSFDQADAAVCQGAASED